ncbi:MAG: SxtJ family membrane protein [Candidatus Omnitrophica bacterium]|nr:SxtJ family membrane protein [Candidatus Omnitrophota bacterium]MDD5552669.1 SxtJ family membrane protein [Candidatus Omnitrophota bacterium]
MEKLNFNKIDLKKFGITMAAAFIAIASILALRHKHSFLPLSISAGFFLAAIIAPLFLKPFYIFWMRLAFVLSWVNTRLILFILFFLVFAPMGIMMRIFGKDFLERKIDKKAGSYWKKAEKKVFSRSDHERQF